MDVILNSASNRQTATAVSVQGSQRFLGDEGAAMARSNVVNTIQCMKMLVGRRFDDPDTQKELSKQPFKATKLPSGGVGIIVSYAGEPKTISAEHFMAMMLVKAKEIAAKANNNVMIGDAVLAVPHNFTDAQRRGVLNACEIASLPCIKITNESNAIALSYGIFKSAKQLFSDKDPQHFMFIDMGYTGYCVTVVAFIQENMRVLSTVCERGLGGRDFDDIIIEFLAETFQKKTGIDVRKNPKAILKLQVAAEKAKKTLSPNGVTEAPVNVECLAEEKDLSVILTKDEFESRSSALIARLEAPVLKCLEESQLKKQDIVEVEIVGGGSRVNSVKKRLGEILGLDASAINYGLKTTMNSDEAVARGGALQCAMVSSRMKVKPFNIVDKLPYGIIAAYDADAASAASSSQGAADGEDGGDEAAGGNQAQLYTRNFDVPYKPRRLTFRKKTASFPVTLRYDAEAAALLPPGEDLTIAKYIVKLPPNSPPVDVRVTFNIDKNGCVYLQSAQSLEEVPVVVAADPPPAVPAASEGKEGDAAAAGTDPAGAAPAPAAPTEAASVEPAKKRFKKIDLEVVVDAFGLSREDIKASLELEAAMAFEDQLIVATADKRNELEAYVYSMRDKLDGALRAYCSDQERTTFQAALNDAEEWLYGDGSEAKKSEYQGKVDTLRASGNPIEQRMAEESGRAGAAELLRKQVDKCKEFCANYDDKYAHITEEERESVRKHATASEAWLFDMQEKQAELPKYVDPVLSIDAIAKQRNELFKTSNPVMTKRAPPPPTPAAPTGSEADAKGSEGAANGESKEGAGPGAEGKAEGKGEGGGEGEGGSKMDVDGDFKNSDEAGVGEGDSPPPLSS